MKIVLVGYMGSGKSTIGRVLANTMNMSFLDLDEHIEVSLEKTIPVIFETKGEIFFRKKEHQYVQEVLDRQESIVLATGGGTPCYAGNMDIMMEKADYVFYLKVSLPELVRRLDGQKEERPIIKNIQTDELHEFIGKHLFERSYYYNKASYAIACDHKNPTEIAREIENKIRQG